MGSRKFRLNEVTKVTSIKEMLKLAVKEDGDKIAFKYKGKDDRIVQVIYKQFVRDTEELGTALASIGMHDKHIAMIGENSTSVSLCFKTFIISLHVSSLSTGTNTPVLCKTVK